MGFEAFIRETAPLLGLQARPFQRRGIKRRIERRITEVGVHDLDEYLLRVKKDPEEQELLSQIFTVTISRFFRDREVFATIETFLIPSILKRKEKGNVRVWSIGCASGEEPYSLVLIPWPAKLP